MTRFARLKKPFLKLKKFNETKKPLRHVKKVKHVRWLLPGWVFYEYYKVHKNKGQTRAKSIGHGAKAEVIRIAAMASLPLPGTYELTTTGLALLKHKIESGDIEKFSLRSFRDFMPLRKYNREAKGQPYLRIYREGKKIHFKIFYKKNVDKI